ncbi:hypothetical protein HYS00_01610, partial [Candidatus Microgenomates bacterium]|nr:hypothetical protein [Candidatus Microgenomates bacterium]
MNYLNTHNGSGWPSAWGGGFISILLIFAAVDMALKGYALWRAARHGQSGWFVALLVFNTLAILPLLYIFVFQNKSADVV